MPSGHEPLSSEAESLAQRGDPTTEGSARSALFDTSFCAPRLESSPQKVAAVRGIRTAAGMFTGLPCVLEILPIRSGTVARRLVRLARNRRVDVAWVPGVHAGSVGLGCVIKVLPFGGSLVSRALTSFYSRTGGSGTPRCASLLLRSKGSEPVTRIAAWGADGRGRTRVRSAGSAHRRTASARVPDQPRGGGRRSYRRGRDQGGPGRHGQPLLQSDRVVEIENGPGARGGLAA